ncbi:helicase associated domain-containing protein [Streptomyces sp. NPDC003042]
MGPVGRGPAPAAGARLTPAAGAERPPPRRGHAAARAEHVEAARRFPARERRLRVPRTQVEPVGGREVRLGAWIAHQRSRAASPAPERVAALTALGMRSSASG